MAQSNNTDASSVAGSSGEIKPAVAAQWPEEINTLSAYGSLQNSGSSPDKLTIALAWIHASKIREIVFGHDFFCDPLWAMFLHLYVRHCHTAALEEQEIQDIISASPAAAQRWMAVLEQGGLVRRLAHPEERDRSRFSLSDQGVAQMEIALTMASEEDRQLGIGRLRLVK